jgi:hypothetical protein
MTPLYRALLATAFGLSAGMLHAQTAPVVTQQSIEAAYAGYERIEIQFGLTQVKVEATDAETGQKIEAIYDALTGTILKQEVYTVAAPVVAGTEIKTRDRDFLKPRNPRAEAKGDNRSPRAEDRPSRNDDADEVEDESGDDRGGNGRGRDDRGRDDRGGDNRGGKGSDDRGRDDHGDDHGSDDHGDD